MRRPIADGLFTWPGDAPQLIGSRCGVCGETTFPRANACPRCTSTDVAEHLLGTRGRLWTWTVQCFRPKPPFGLDADADFEPYGVGYVELDGETRVETRLTGVDLEQIEIGMDLELVIEPLWRDGDTEVVTFAFAPVTGGDR